MSAAQRTPVSHESYFQLLRDKSDELVKFLSSINIGAFDFCMLMYIKQQAIPIKHLLIFGLKLSDKSSCSQWCSRTFALALFSRDTLITYLCLNFPH